jgi:hypothetical protein
VNFLYNIFCILAKNKLYTILNSGVFSIDDFERSMTDVIRFQKGSRSLTASEAEEKGIGRRRIVRRPQNTSDDEDDEDEIFPQLASAAAPISASKKTVASKRAASSSYLTNEVVTPKKMKIVCSLSRKGHYCFLEEQPVTLESLAKGLCTLSSKYFQVFLYVVDIYICVSQSEEHFPHFSTL